MKVQNNDIDFQVSSGKASNSVTKSPCSSSSTSNDNLANAGTYDHKFRNKVSSAFKQLTELAVSVFMFTNVVITHCDVAEFVFGQQWNV